MPEHLESIDALIDRFQAGIDRDKSFERIFKLYYSRIRSFFLKKRFSDDESSDLTQESLIQIYRSLSTFRRETRFETWVFRVLSNVYYNELRRRSTGKRHGVEQALDPALPAERDSEPLDSAINKERRHALQIALQSLPPQMHRCIILRIYGNLSYREIAIVMQISIDAVKAHLHQARKRLQKELGKAEDL